jgi:hypothetical protein
VTRRRDERPGEDDRILRRAAWRHRAMQPTRKQLAEEAEREFGWCDNPACPWDYRHAHQRAATYVPRRGSE